MLTDDIQKRMRELIYQQQEAYEYNVHALEIMPDHVHLLAAVSPQHSVSTVVGRIKGFVSKVLRDEFPELKSRLPTLWTRSKFISSTGGVTLDVLKQYVENQKGK